MKKILLAIMLLTVMTMNGQNDWKQFDKLMSSASYKSAYNHAAKRFESSTDAAERLAAAYHMARAASYYQEEAHDSAEARYRSLLPSLPPLEKALCYAFLNEYDSALSFASVLQQTSASQIAMYCNVGKEPNVTPTAYDVIIYNAQQNYLLTYQQQVEWQQQLVDFHRHDADDLRLWHELRLLELQNQVPNRQSTMADYVDLANRYRGSKSPRLTEVYYKLATLCEEQQRYVETVRYCDSAIALAPKSLGATMCANKKAQIIQPQARIASESLTVAPRQVSLHRATYRNTSTLHFRIIHFFDTDVTKKRMLAEKPLEQWSQPVVGNDEYRWDEQYVTLPALKAGHYWLLVSPTADFKAEGFMSYQIISTDMLLIGSEQSGLVVDRQSGHPIVGQEVRLVSNRYETPRKTLDSVATDANGRYQLHTLEEHRRSVIEIERDGVKLKYPTSFYGGRSDTSMHPRCTVCLDRPIYRPNDTVQAAIILYESNGIEAHALPADSLRVELVDANNEKVQECTVRTDDFGMASVRFHLPADRLAGRWVLLVKRDGTTLSWNYVRVEEYRQPRFMTTLAAQEGKTPQFGTPLTVEGWAASYSDVPIAGARVQYSIARRLLSNWWYVVWEEEFASGETTTNADGSFHIDFTPMPDSNVELSVKPTFEYVVRVDVTDINGESHPAETSLRVGYANAFVRLKEGSTMDNLQPLYVDINGNPLPGKVDMQVERLQQPRQPLLDHPTVKANTHCGLTAKEFHRHFPLLAPDVDYNNPDKWKVAEKGWNGKSGVYRITLAAEGADTSVTYITHTAPEATRVQSQQLLWAEVDKKTVEVGDKATLRFGTRFADVDFYYMLRVGDSERDFRRITLGDALQSITIEVDSAMLGGFTIDLIAAKEGIMQHFTQEVHVPFSHKKLDVKITTFRNKLQPGSQEEWTLQVNGQEGGVASALVMTMYDDALNSFGHAMNWTIDPWRINQATRWQQHDLYPIQRSHTNTPKEITYQGEYPSAWTLQEALPHYHYYHNFLMRMSRSARMPVREEIASMPVSEDAVFCVVEEEAEEAYAATSLAKKTMADAMPPTAGQGDNGSNAEPTVRTNLNSLAFFAPALHSDAAGQLTYRFTLPELLTRWNVRGLALTKDIKTGQLSENLVAQKPLMLQPNMPRFLRSGDSLALMAKLVLAEPTESPVHVEVDFLLTDAATGDTLCIQQQHTSLTQSTQLTFPIEVPQHVHVATYRIVATAENMSDGEQGQIPVVSNRQAVSISQALYINGTGEKHYHVPEWLVREKSRDPLLLTVEMTTNPMWLAVKSMPYFTSFDNPSSTYLAERIHVNSIGQKITQQLNVEQLWTDSDDTQPSRLRMNEEVKQTLLQATPWVQDAADEEEQRAMMKRYFDPARMAAEQKADLQELFQRQQSNGGWSWMPDGEISLWATQQVLLWMHGLCPEHKDDLARAQEFVDRKEQEYYEAYIKPHLSQYATWNPTNIAYLYERSLYGKASTEAYKFYYKNALKNYTHYTNLYTQAQLALIFHRHGDHKAARELLRRIKEKSLYSDEMGLYWRDNISSYYWYQRPIETQAMLIQAFAEITPKDTTTIAQMQQWLLKQKQTTHWGNSLATLHAIQALMAGGEEQRTVATPSRPVEMTVFGATVETSASGLEGYSQQQWRGHSLDSLQAQQSDDITIRKHTQGIAWGAVYYQFEDDMDKIPASDMGISIRRTYSLVQAITTDSHPTPLDEARPLQVGDRIRVHIDIDCDRAMDYLELIDGRPSCTEPLSTQAGWRWNSGLQYYITVGNTDTRCYIEHLDKGKYWFEYDLYVTNPGQFLTGAATMQCMYAPEFRAIAPAQRMTVGGREE